MKKIGKKLSYFTKVFLVLSLLFSNLSGLSVVFAYETSDSLVLETEKNNIIIKYNDEIEDTANVRVEISENYTYLGGTTETPLTSTKSTDGASLKSTEGVTYVSKMLSNVIFDGTYNLNVSLYDEEDNEIAISTYQKEITHDSGLAIKVYDSSSNEIIKDEQGLYNIDGDVQIKYNILPGGLDKNAEYVVTFSDETTANYTAEELIGYEFALDRPLKEIIFGEYTDIINQEFKLVDSEEIITASGSVSFKYGDYTDNADALNEITTDLGLDNKYLFSSNDKDGIMYVYPNKDEAYSVNDLFAILDKAVEETTIKYTISNDEIADLEANYQEYLASFTEESEETPLTKEEYYKETFIDSSTMISLSTEDITITFKAILLGDMNDDLVIDESDLEELTSQIIGKNEANLLNGDLNLDSTLDVKDAINLYQAYKNNIWNIELTEATSTTEKSLEVKSEDIISGDEFTVEYLLKVTEDKINGLAGMVNYDKDSLELVDIKTDLNWIGSNHDGKFLYLGDEVLTGTINENQEINPNEYVAITMTFKALKAGTSKISLTDNEMFGLDTIYILDESDLSTEVTVNTSSDNTLSSLQVAGQDIELQEDVLEYQITVENDVTLPDVKALTNNVAASITAITAPEELAVGDNEIIITVMAENGNELIYKVIVTRKEAPKEETPQQVTYQEPTNDNSNDNTIDTPTTPDDGKKDDDNKTTEEKDGKVSRIIIIILILLVIAGLIYLIFKDEDDDETKKANKDINKMKKEPVTKPIESKNNKINNSSKKTSNNKNNKK